MKKLLFLEIDGVLNNTASLEEAIHIIPEKVVMLREVCLELDVDIVISGSWKLLYELSEVRAILEIAGLGKARIIGKTPDLSGSFTGNEIVAYLSEIQELYQYCIVDDTSSNYLEEQKAFVILTDVNAGLTSKDVSRIRYMLI